AFRQALDRVLERVTGRRDVAEQPEAAALRSRARSMVQQWSYTRQGLWAMFDAALLGQELRAAGLPQWGAERPLLLVWVAIDDDLQPAFVLGTPQLEVFSELMVGDTVGDDILGDESLAQPVDEAALREVLDQVAAQRGLPLILPKMDAVERALVTPEQLCGRDFSSFVPSREGATPARAARADDAARLRTEDSSADVDELLADITGDVAWQVAARRYRADGILIGCARLLGERMIIDWTLQLAEGERRRWRGDLAEGPHGAADVLARALAPVAGESGRQALRIGGIGSLADYAKVMRHLETLSLIDAVDIERVNGDTLHLSVRTRADAEQLRRALLIGRTLAPLVGAEAAAGAYTLVR
ncbi:MAG: DUF2066 domain-containing protein, partial [Gammaproteobacteria bacterium]|nr:DUF2066 domain-containing protein [Gammaproteobacteria bacterium]